MNDLTENNNNEVMNKTVAGKILWRLHSTDVLEIYMVINVLMILIKPMAKITNNLLRDEKVRY